MTSDPNGERENELQAARMLFDNLDRFSPYMQANMYINIEQYLRLPEDYEKCLGITRDEFMQRKHAVFVARGVQRLAAIRAGDSSAIEGLVEDVVYQRCTLAELNLSADEFKGYAGKAAIKKADEMLVRAYDSYNDISRILAAANISAGDEMHASVSKITGAISAYLTFE